MTDPTGAFIPRARIELEQVQTGISSARITSISGEYTFTHLDPGTYHLTAAAEGFKTRTVKSIILQLDQTARVDLEMQLGEAATTVEVAATAAVVQSENSSVSSVVDGSQIATMPLDGRSSIFGLLALAPGVQRPGQNPLITGAGWNGSTNMTVDGVSNIDVGTERLVGVLVSLDALAEFKVIASGAPAEFGRGGAQVLAVTKSGSNELHGSLFAFNRNGALSAKNFFATHLPKPHFNRNEFGAALGGPVVRSRLFYFGSFEGMRRRESVTSTTAMPTVALKQGDFRGLPAIRDPLTRTPYPENRIPRTAMIPTAIELMQFATDPNLPGTGAAGLGNNLTLLLPTREVLDRYSVRVDDNVSAHDRVMARYYRADNGPYLSGISGGTDKFGNWAGFGVAVQNLAASWLHVFSPALIVEARGGLNRETIFRVPQNGDYDPTRMIRGLTAPLPGLGGLPTVAIDGFRGFSDQQGTGDRKRNYEIAGDLTRVRHRHTVKMGAEFRHAFALNFQNPLPARGRFAFDGRYTGHPFADFLTGAIASTGRVNKNVEVDLFNNRYGAYVQDDWAASRNLTINAGLRYEYAGVIRPDRGDLSNFYPHLQKLVVIRGTPDARLLAVPVVAGVDVGLDTGNYIRPDRNNFAPRIGFAYRPLGHRSLVLRSSYGVYHNVIGNYSHHMATNPPFVAAETFEPSAGPAPTLTWANPFPGAGGLPSSPFVSAMAANRRTPYHQQWNFTVEGEVAPNTAVRLSYLGNKGTHLERQFNLNDPPPAPGAVQPRRPYQPFGPISYLESGRNSISHQLQAGAIRRVASGAAFEIEYQFTRALGEQVSGGQPQDNRNARLDRGNLDFVQRHRTTANYIYELPFYRGRRWLGGWRVAGILIHATGQPFSVTFTSRVLGWPSGRADIVGRPLPSKQTIERWFDPAAFAPPQPFTYGNSARNMLFGPGLFSWDAALFKTIPVTDRLRLDIRAEAFNALNRANFGQPRSNISETALVGRISSAADARNIQFGMRMVF